MVVATVRTVQGDRPPVVGITTAELFTPGQTMGTAEAEPTQRKLSLGMDYPNAVLAAGGVPVVLPPVAAPAPGVIERLDALVVSGGPDLDPALYGAAPHPLLGPVEREADPRELALVREAIDRGMPVLAICRGMQLLNVVRGGTLWQDVPSELGTELVHRQLAPGWEVAHPVSVVPGTRLAELTGATAASPELEVNSFHHQAVRDLGAGLRITARAPDGVVEALEDPDHPFLVGVQWHAESLASGIAAQASLFQGLINATGRRPVALAA